MLRGISVDGKIVIVIGGREKEGKLFMHVCLCLCVVFLYSMFVFLSLCTITLPLILKLLYEIICGFGTGNGRVPRLPDWEGSVCLSMSTYHQEMHIKQKVNKT